MIKKTLLLCFIGMLVCYGWSVTRAEPDQIASTDLSRTRFTAHLDTPVPATENLLYCATFQLAWNGLQDDVIGAEILLAGDPPAAASLNLQRTRRSDLHEDSYVAMAEKLTPEFLMRINRVLKEKFGENAPPEVKEMITPDTFFSYAYLFKNLMFPYPFESMEAPVVFKSGDRQSPVLAFGVKKFDVSRKEHRDMASQVEIFDYVDAEHFIVRLTGKPDTDEIILVRGIGGKTLLETVTGVIDGIDAGKPEALSRDDSLMIPKMDYNIKHDFMEFVGKRFKNPGWEAWYISKAMQWIRFRFDEKGALLKSEARISMRLTAMRPGPPPKQLVFDGPFLMMFKQKNTRLPYLVMWVGDPEILLTQETGKN